jgi:hypothetical protein
MKLHQANVHVGRTPHVHMVFSANLQVRAFSVIVRVGGRIQKLAFLPYRPVSAGFR